MNRKLPQGTLGYLTTGGVKARQSMFSLTGYIASLWSKEKQVRQSPLTQERERFEKEVKQQFLQLKEKGLSISVFTL